MSERKKLTISIVTVTLIAIIVVGATFAYWSWVSGTNEKTNISLSVPSGSSLLKADLDGGSFNVSGLAPTSCGNDTFGAKFSSTLTYTNETNSPAHITGTLTVNNFTKPHGSTTGTIKPTTEDLRYLKYSLRTNDTDCNSGTEIAHGDFANLYNQNNGVIMNNVALATDIAAGTVNTTKLMHLYIWLDSAYQYTNTGSNNVSDPMQDLSFVISWSGEINNTPNPN